MTNPDKSLTKPEKKLIKMLRAAGLRKKTSRRLVQALHGDVRPTRRTLAELVTVVGALTYGASQTPAGADASKKAARRMRKGRRTTRRTVRTLVAR